MWILQLFGVLDFLSLASLLLVHYNVLGWNPGYLFAMYLVFKGIYFWGGSASLFDVTIGLFFVLMFFGFRSTLIVWAAALYMLQKVLLSVRHF